MNDGLERLPTENRAAFFCEAHPSLALLKYWGKSDPSRNLPATPSLALALGALTTRTRAEASFEGEDEVSVDGTRQPPERYAAFFATLRRALRADLRFKARSRNGFPTASGLASSSSGFAALTLACIRSGEAVLKMNARPRLGTNRGSGNAGGLGPTRLSALARVGSASAARAIFGGFSLLPAGSRAARPLFGSDHWPELRVLVALVSTEGKPVSSREAMERCRRTSPFYRSWVRGAANDLPEAVEALEGRDLERLGAAARRSYLRMFGTMLACDPPLLYWLPGSLVLIRECEAMRAQGIGVWESMDAGPQVKMLCLASEASRIADRLRATETAASLIESPVGGPPSIAAAPIEVEDESGSLER